MADYGISGDEISGIASFLFAGRKVLRLTPTRRVISSNLACVLKPRKSAAFYACAVTLSLPLS
jgi:hypothetical protein